MIFPTLEIEQGLWAQGHKLICGLDEVGRGCFAGPVVVGVVVFPQDVVVPEGVADSKLLTPKKRQKLAQEIKEVALEWKIAEVSVEVINQVGIGKAAQLAFKQAVESLENGWDYCLIDAFFINGLDRSKQKPIVGGDKICASISAASIIAKVYRDELMVKLHEQYPEYGFDKHKGYGSKQHQEALKKHGLCSIHRTSFNLDKFLH
jgi:ribonuclease HII